MGIDLGTDGVKSPWPQERWTSHENHLDDWGRRRTRNSNQARHLKSIAGHVAERLGESKHASCQHLQSNTLTSVS
jgi:hypothetical protein